MVHSRSARLAPSSVRSTGSAVATTTTSSEVTKAPREARTRVQVRRFAAAGPAGFVVGAGVVIGVVIRALPRRIHSTYWLSVSRAYLRGITFSKAVEQQEAVEARVARSHL